MPSPAIGTSSFAQALKAITRSSAARAVDTAVRVDQKAGLSGDGRVEVNEIYEFAGQAGLLGRGLSLSNRRMATAAMALADAVTSTESKWAKVPIVTPDLTPPPVNVASLSGMLQVKNDYGRVVIETSRKAFAQRVAGTQTQLHAADFAAAARFLKHDELWFCRQMLIEEFLSKPLGSTSASGRSPGGRALTVDATWSGVMGFQTDYSTSAKMTLSLQLSRNEVVFDETTQQSYVPDRSGKVTMPMPTGEISIISRGVHAKVEEQFSVSTYA